MTYEELSVGGHDEVKHTPKGASLLCISISSNTSTIKKEVSDQPLSSHTPAPSPTTHLAHPAAT